MKSLELEKMLYKVKDKEEMKVLIKRVMKEREKVLSEINLLSIKGEEVSEMLEVRKKWLDELLEEIIKKCDRKGWSDVVSFLSEEIWRMRVYNGVLKYLRRKYKIEK